MFGIGWSELLLVGVICLFVFGPEDIPKVMYNLGRIVRRLRYLQYAMSSQFEDFMDKAEAAPKKPAKPTEEIPDKDTHEYDESDADAYLMEMLPPPENLPDIEIALPDDEPDTRPKSTPAIDRG